MFRDRYDAGRRLAAALAGYKGGKDTLILAIPRGALQIGEVLYRELGLPLDIIVTKKIPHPMSVEYAIGAVGPDGEYFVNAGAAAEIGQEYVEIQRKKLAAAVEERYARYRGARAKPLLKGKTVILVDDGIATGSTVLAAIHIIRKHKPKKIVVAVPVGPPDSVAMIAAEADEMVCLEQPSLFHAIGAFYEDFAQVEDEEAIAILKRCRTR
ncbi:phosphoribosyltransferase [Candidatus Micrarchaeota archaeon]|nr:phosphoribosyltransferase [Candidatus Micrarchaeota archaeon]